MTAAAAVLGILATAVPAGATTDYDYTGDGTADVAVYRVPTAGFFWGRSRTTGIGSPYAVPVPANWRVEYAPDRITPLPNQVTDPATFLDGVWSGDVVPVFRFGRRGDVPVPGRWRLRGVDEAAVFRPSTGQWFVRGGASFGFGRRGDLPMAFDGTGDGLADAVIYRPSTGRWYVRGGLQGLAFGRPGDIPVPADYDGDGGTDIAVYRPATRQWFVRGVAALSGRGFGGASDVPVPADYDGDGDADLAVWRPSSSTWYITGRAPQAYGRGTDVAGSDTDLPARRDLLTLLD